MKHDKDNDLISHPTAWRTLATFVLDHADRIWALRSRAVEDDAAVFEVLDPTGRHLETVAVPASLATHPFPVIRGGWMVAVEVDAFGRQRVVLGRVPERIR